MLFVIVCFSNKRFRLKNVFWWFRYSKWMHIIGEHHIQLGPSPQESFSREFIWVENILFPFIETFVIIIFIKIFLIVIVFIFTLFFLALEWTDDDLLVGSHVACATAGDCRCVTRAKHQPRAVMHTRTFILTHGAILLHYLNEARVLMLHSQQKERFIIYSHLNSVYKLCECCYTL